MRIFKYEHYTKPGEAYHISRSNIIIKRPFPLHGHDYAEIFWLERGEGIHVINGNSIPLKKGNLIMVRPGDEHGFKAFMEEGFSVLNIAFPLNTLTLIRERYLSDDLPYWRESDSFPCMLQLSRRQMDWLNAQADRLSRSGRPLLQIDCFLLNLLSILREEDSASGEICNGPPWLVKALRAMQYPENFRKGAHQLAFLAGRSPEHVSRVLKISTGRKPTDIVNRARMDYAAQRLAMSQDEIQEIALNCGFQSLGHFYKCFKQYFEMSPRQYRLRHMTVAGMG